MKTYLVLYSNGLTEFLKAESFFDVVKDIKEFCEKKECAVKQVILFD